IYQLFQNGIVLGSEDTGTHALVGRIAKEWASGDNAATLGLPTSDEVPTGLGKEVRVQFQGGSTTPRVPITTPARKQPRRCALLTSTTPRI
ncbi:LGFP repeat-containing protein, partial [Corynebacterium hesseae]|uniref:LGFP repeat-containing protein n=1 Tax=Corynebacterium hesseae TaxID=2913502 RepID=UPI00373FA2EE